MTGAATGAPPVDGPGIEQLIADLGSPDFTHRAAADEALQVRDDVTLADLEARMGNPGLDPEQRARLGTLARLKFGSSSRAALGIQFSAERGGFRGIEPPLINKTVEGFDSVRVLRPGDAVISFEGVRVSDQQEMRSHILSYDPGEIAHLQVERDEKVIDIEVRMGSQEQLNRSDDPLLIEQRRFDAPTREITEADKNDAWDVRVARKHLDIAERCAVLDGEFAAGAWRLTDAQATPAEDPRTRGAEMKLTSGGSARGGGPESARPFAGGQYQDTGRQRAARDPGDAQIQNMIRQLDATIAELHRQAASTRPDQLNQLLARIQTFQSRRDELAKFLANQQIRNSFPRAAQPRR